MRGAHKGKVPNTKTQTTWTTTQSETVQADGRVDITLTSTDGDSTVTRMVTLAEAADGHFSITDTHRNRETVQTISADPDGGVDVRLTTTSSSGEVMTRTFDLDLNAAGELVISSQFTGTSGNTATHAHTLDLATFLGAAGAPLTVAEVAETYLDMRGVDVTLTGVADLLA
jgi:hypothetical protein